MFPIQPTNYKIHLRVDGCVISPAICTRFRRGASNSVGATGQ